MELKEGVQVIVKGRWMIVESDDGDGFFTAIDDDGMDYTINENMVDHIYEDEPIDME